MEIEGSLPLSHPAFAMSRRGFFYLFSSCREWHYDSLNGRSEGFDPACGRRLVSTSSPYVPNVVFYQAGLHSEAVIVYKRQFITNIN